VLTDATRRNACTAVGDAGRSRRATLSSRAGARGEELGAQEPIIATLTTAPGINLVVAAAFVSVIDSAKRFTNARQVESYVGLVPRERVRARDMGNNPVRGSGCEAFRARGDLAANEKRTPGSSPVLPFSRSPCSHLAYMSVCAWVHSARVHGPRSSLPSTCSSVFDGTIRGPEMVDSTPGP
jgi:hypothetical protein